MVNSGKVSIIMPAYNAEQFIASAIESVLGQTYKDIELIIVEDKSSDNTPEVIQRYVDADSRITFIRNEKNLGISGATNAGMRIATGKYLAFHDNDDIMLPEKIEQCLVSLRDKNEYIGVVTGGTYVDEQDYSLGVDAVIPAYLYENSYMVRAFERSYIPTWAMFLRREEIQGLSFDERILCGNQDFDFFLRMLYLKKKFFYLGKPLIHYRLHSNNHHKHPSDVTYVYSKHKPEDIAELYNHAGYSGFVVVQALGHVHFYQKNYQCSLGCFEQALDIGTSDDEFFLAYFMMASALFELMDYAECLKKLYLALSIKESPEVYNNIGVCERKFGTVDGASHFSKAIELFPQYGDANKNSESPVGVWYTSNLIRSVHKSGI